MTPRPTAAPIQFVMPGMRWERVIRTSDSVAFAATAINRVAYPGRNAHDVIHFAIIADVGLITGDVVDVFWERVGGTAGRSDIADMREHNQVLR